MVVRFIFQHFVFSLVVIFSTNSAGGPTPKFLSSPNTYNKGGGYNSRTHVYKPPITEEVFTKPLEDDRLIVVDDVRAAIDGDTT